VSRWDRRIMSTPPSGCRSPGATGLVGRRSARAVWGRLEAVGDR
jgi:hypothetical protein